MAGSLKEEVYKAIFEAMPAEVSFVDVDDRVVFFNKGMNRIFPRPDAIIGRRVQQCHPHKSLNVVERILQDFKAGKRENAEFWIDHKNRKILIRYFPVRDNNEQYLGTLEFTIDITDIQKIEGEKRLLD
ncbi:MAG: PAS domain-containing protein [Candidatus Thorarchaeota archaeon]